MKGRGNFICADMERALKMCQTKTKKERWKMCVDSSPICVKSLGMKQVYLFVFACVCIRVTERMHKKPITRGKQGEPEVLGEDMAFLYNFIVTNF